MAGLTFLGLFSAIFFAYYFYLKFRHKERTMLIEKDVDIADFYKKTDKQQKSHRGFPWYLVGFTLFGIGLGIGLSQIFVFIVSHRLEFYSPGPIIVSLTMIFGALGIILGHSFERKKAKLRG